MKRAFTLIEMLVVIAIMAILAALIFPAIGRSKESANRTRCLSNLKQIGLAFKNYAYDNNQQFPYTSNGQDTWDSILLKDNYLTQPVLVCPSDKTKRTVPGDIRSYAYNGYIGDLWDNDNTLKGASMRIDAPSARILAADRGSIVSVVNSPLCANAFQNDDCTLNHTTGANYVFVDLHAEWLTNSGNFGQAGDSDSTKLFQLHWLPPSQIPQ